MNKYYQRREMVNTIHDVGSREAKDRRDKMSTEHTHKIQ